MKGKGPKSVQKAIRVPESLWADVEFIYKNSPVRFEYLSDCVRFLLEEGVARHLPTEVVAERQAEINKKVAEEEELRKWGREIIEDTMAKQARERKKAG